MQKLHSPRCRNAVLLALLLGSAVVSAPAHAQSQQTRLTVSSNQYGITQNVTIGINKSMIVDLPAEVSDVIISQPAVAGAIMRTNRRAILQGVSAGDTNILFLDANGRTIAVINATIEEAKSNIGTALQATINRVLPGTNIQVESVLLTNADGQQINRVVLSGTADSTDDAAKALTIAGQFAGDPGNVASVINITGPQQVMLKVTVAEVTRETVKELGINLSASFAGLTTSVISNNSLGGASNVLPTSAIGGSTGLPGIFSLSASLQALERRGALRTLAEPTLTAMSGQPAEFLAGGDYPVPTELDKDGRVTYTFKKFGVNLAFTPTIKSSGIIGLQVDTSVSEPTTEGSFTASAGNGVTVTIPASKERSAKTTVELGSGMTLAIGGLMQDQVRQQINQFPGLANIPILGALFRSRDFVRAQTELVILVTPYLVQPSQNIALPTDGAVPASDAEAVFLGKLESQYGVGNGAGMRGSIKGSVGFVLD